MSAVIIVFRVMVANVIVSTSISMLLPFWMMMYKLALLVLFCFIWFGISISHIGESDLNVCNLFDIQCFDKQICARILYLINL